MYDDKPIKVDAGPKKINNIYMGPEVEVISIEKGKQNLFYRGNKKQFSSTFIILLGFWRSEYQNCFRTIVITVTLNTPSFQKM